MVLTLPSDHEIVMTRTLDAPRRLVWEAYTRPEHLAQWWGPRGHSMPVCEMDLRPGGTWRYVSRDQDGNEYGFHGEWREVVPPERVTWTFEFDGAPGHVSVETATFEEHGGRTTITVRADY